MAKILNKGLRIHNLDQVLDNNRGDKINIDIVGVGATGSHILYSLAALYSVQQKIGGRLFNIRAYDFDSIERHNIGKQGFFDTEVGQNKAVSIISRINRSYGLNWMAFDRKYDADDNYDTNIIISCVDSWKTRQYLWDSIRSKGNKYQRQQYWLDIGNGKNDGQIILQAESDKKRLISIIEHAKGSKISKEDEKVSCSMVQSLENQGMFINKFMAVAACEMLYKLIYLKQLDHRGLIINLDKGIMMPLKL